MTNHIDDASLRARVLPFCTTMVTFGAIAAVFWLATHTIPINALLAAALGAGWVVAGWLYWADRQRRRRDQAARVYTQEQTRDRAFHRAISGPAWQHIGRTERDTVLDWLAEQYAAERLTDDDHEQRAAAATRAVTTADLRATLEGLL